MFDVIVYGLVCLDMVLRVPFLPGKGDAVRIQEEQKCIGGEAANTAIALARWGVRVALVGNVLGDDDEGRLLRRLFARDAPELDLRFLTNSPNTQTSVPIIVSTPDGAKTIFGRGTGHLHFPPIPGDLLAQVRLLTVDGGAGTAGLREWGAASEAGIPVISVDYDDENAGPNTAAVLILSSDNLEAEASPQALLDRATSMRDRRGASILITCGDQGCIVAGAAFPRSPAEFTPAYIAPEVLDTTGAGDVFRAGIIFGHLQNWTLNRSVRFASAAAALNCGAVGGWAGVRPVDEILAWMEHP